MHERTQRAVARLLFVFCCAVPTFLVISAIMVSWSPWYQSRKLAELTYRLGRETGLEFQIEQCRRIAPGKYVLNQVHVSDPDSGRLVGTVRMVDYFHGPEHVAIMLHQPELQSAGLGDAWRLLHDRLISRPAKTVLPISIAATDVNIRSRTGGLPPMDLMATITPEGKSVRMMARAEDPSDHHGARIRVELFRDRDLPKPATRLVLSTEGTALPCSALAEYSAAVRSLGMDALFAGTIRCDEDEQGWSYDLSGSKFERVNLDQLTEQLPDRVIGTADLQLIRCKLDPGLSVNLVGTLKTPEDASVRLDDSMLVKLRDELGMLVDERPLDDRSRGIECKMGIHFDIRDQSLRLTGIGGEAALYSGGRAIAWAGTQMIDADRVTSMLSPPHRWLAAWNQVLLPTVPEPKSDGRPGAAFRNVRNLNAEPSIRQE